jgi:hypothetical protein
LGRFSANEPLAGGGQNPQGFNLLSYVHNDPVNNTDPDGRVILSPECLIDASCEECDPFLGCPEGEGSGVAASECNPYSVEGNSCPPQEPAAPPPSPCDVQAIAEAGIEVNCSITNKKISTINLKVQGSSVGRNGGYGRAANFKVTTQSGGTSGAVVLKGLPFHDDGDTTSWHQNIQADAPGVVMWTVHYECHNFGGVYLPPVSTKISCAR